MKGVVRPFSMLTCIKSKDAFVAGEVPNLPVLLSSFMGITWLSRQSPIYTRHIIPNFENEQLSSLASGIIDTYKDTFPIPKIHSRICAYYVE